MLGRSPQTIKDFNTKKSKGESFIYLCFELYENYVCHIAHALKEEEKPGLDCKDISTKKKNKMTEEHSTKVEPEIKKTLESKL